MMKFLLMLLLLGALFLIAALAGDISSDGDSGLFDFDDDDD